MRLLDSTTCSGGATSKILYEGGAVLIYQSKTPTVSLISGGLGAVMTYMKALQLLCRFSVGEGECHQASKPLPPLV